MILYTSTEIVFCIDDFIGISEARQIEQNIKLSLQNCLRTFDMHCSETLHLKHAWLHVYSKKITNQTQAMKALLTTRWTSNMIMSK